MVLKNKRMNAKTTARQQSDRQHADKGGRHEPGMANPELPPPSGLLVYIAMERNRDGFMSLPNLSP